MTLNMGLMAFWADFEPRDIEALRQWHNCEHMSERVNIPGFLRGRRYRGFDSAATFLMYYETQSPDVLTSPAYQAALNSPTAWTKETLKLFRNPSRAIFELVDESGQKPTEPAFFLTTIRFDIAGDRSQVVRAFRESGLPAIAAQDHVIRARLWENQKSITGIQTKESSIYGKNAGDQQFVVFVESRKRLPQFDLQDLPGIDSFPVQELSDPVFEFSWLDFSLR